MLKNTYKLIPSLAQNDGITNPLIPKLSELGGVDYFGRLIRSFIGLGFILGAIIFVFMFILGAIQWMVSGGDKAAIESARGRVTNAITGLVVLFALFAILALLEVFFGIDLMELDLSSIKLETSP